MLEEEGNTTSLLHCSHLGKLGVSLYFVTERYVNLLLLDSEALINPPCACAGGLL